MGLASSSAVRIDEAYGSLGGAFGTMGQPRKLKKKPVLVLDPEELVKAHQLFQIGAAEALGEFDPKTRIIRSAAEVFGSAHTAPAFDDEEDDYVAPMTLAEDAEVEEENEDDLPPIDLDMILSLSRAEDEAEAEAYAEAKEDWSAAEPEGKCVADEHGEVEFEVSGDAVPDAADAPSPADALARILSRAATATPLEPLDLVEEVEEQIEPSVSEDDEASEDPQANDEEPEVASFAEDTWAVEPEEQSASSEQKTIYFFDSEPDHDLVDTAYVGASHAPVIGEEGTRSALRARLVREDLTLAHPEPSAWRKLMIALRRLFRGY